ncbi:MAG: DUF3445 domain-containing protein [Verrucomicrobiaceae bacterium]|nr:DUF3445 domain-containing protein [Verrucomicrobiaceae bacterium]
MPAFDWFRLFPDASHRLAMNLRPGDAVGYWRDSEEAVETLAERRRWLMEHPERHLGLLPEGRDEVSEALAWIMKVLGQPESTPEHAAMTLEPDWLVLSGDPARDFPVLGGAVVFPSGWALEEKMGRPLHEVHAPVPGLQQALGASISTFLSRVAPLAAWERDNWGLSADPSLNHHPARPLKRLDAAATLDSTWVRLERQFVTRLPVTQAILFGIRVSNHRLDHLAMLPGLASRLRQALETMDETLAGYKGITAAREVLATQLALA